MLFYLLFIIYYTTATFSVKYMITCDYIFIKLMVKLMVKLNNII